MQYGEISAASTDVGTKMNIQWAHAILGHSNEEYNRETAKQLGWVITRGSLKPCAHCAKRKAEQKNVSKESTSNDKATVPGGSVYMDLSKVSVRNSDGSEFELNRKHWKLMVDESTGKKWSDFTESKIEIVEPTCKFLNVMKANEVPITCIKLDPAGENVALEKHTQNVEWAHFQPVKFEFTSRDTPQHNCLAELGFPYLSGKARAMMGAMHASDENRGQVAIKAIKCAKQLDGLQIVTVKGKTCTHDVHVFGSNPKWASNLRTWGEAGVIKEGKDMKANDHGIEMMFIGYPANHEADIVHTWNPATNRVVVTRDVIWLKRMFFEKPDGDEVIFDVVPKH